MNNNYAQYYTEKLNDITVLEAIRVTVPIKGDDEETESILKGLLVLANKGATETIFSHKNIILFIFEALIKHQNLKLDNQVLNAAINFVKSNHANQNLAAVYLGLAPQSQEVVKTLLN